MAGSDTMTVVTPRSLPEHLLASGRYAVSVDEVQELLDLDRRSALSALKRLRDQNKLFSPARGLYVVIPPEFRGWGAVPAVWFVDVMMKHLHRPYYVALLSAARLHGAAHQAPQALQIVSARELKDRQFGRVRLRFYVNSRINEVPTEIVNVQTGTAHISTREATVVDLVNHLPDAGGLSNVATILREIGELNGSELARLSSLVSRATVRRVGWLVDRFGKADDLEALRQASRRDQGEPSLLDPSSRKRGRADPAWALRLNALVEPDL